MTVLKKTVLICFLIAALLCAGCSFFKSVPNRPGDICEIFRGSSEWYQYAARASERWQTPIPILMAIIYHESGFRSDAKPPRTRCLYIFPGPRPSDAYGYPQALDSTWSQYCQATGNRTASRGDFKDAIDFVSWYCHLSQIKCQISQNDAYNLYLAYHEGHGGFNRKTYTGKTWLKQTARNVENRANIYSKQLASCEFEFIEKRGCLQ